MFKSLRNLFKRKTIRWVDNTQIEFEHLEAKQYLLVEDTDEVPMLFTEHQVIQAKKRALKNLEDTTWKQ